MNKSNFFTGQPIFSQLLKLILKDLIAKIVLRPPGVWRSRPRDLQVLLFMKMVEQHVISCCGSEK